MKRRARQSLTSARLARHRPLCPDSIRSRRRACPTRRLKNPTLDQRGQGVLSVGG